MPTDVIISINADGQEAQYDLSAEAIGILDRFTQSLGFQGTFAERFVLSTRRSIAELAMRELQPVAVKTAEPRVRAQEVEK